MRVTRDDTEENREHILDVATRVFAEKGFHAARMDDVVDASGLGKGTVYWHYKSKDGLLSAVMRRFLAFELGRLQKAVSREASVAEGLVQFVHQMTDDLRHLGPLMPLTLDFYAIALRREWARALLREYYAEFRAVLSGIVASGIRSGEFRPVDPEDTAIALTAQMEGLILVWVIDDQAVDIGRHADIALELMLEGLRLRPSPREE